MRRVPRLLTLAAVAVIAAAGFAAAAPALAASAIAAPMPRQHDTLRPVAGTADFTFDSWHSDLQLGLTAEGHSALTTTETIVARFPDFDQNRGIRRAIPTGYDGHPTGLTIESVTDETGAPRDYSEESTSDDSGDYLELTIAGDHYVHGAQTYRITYSRINVTHQPDGSAGDELFWEINGTGWAQPFGTVSASLLVDAAVADKLTGDVRCLQGSADSGADCAEITGVADGAGWRIDATAHDLGAYEGLAIVVGFEPGTFVPRDDSFTASVFPSIGLVGALLAAVGLILGIVARATRWRNAPGRPTIIAEYLPPKGVNLLAAADVTGTSKKVIPALLLNFAVRGNLRVLEGESKKKKTKTGFRLELVHADGLDAQELAVLTALFPGLTPGRQRTLSATDAKLSAALLKIVSAVPAQVVRDGLRTTVSGRRKVGLILVAIVGMALAVVGSLTALSDDIGGWIPLVTLLLGPVLGVGTLLVVSSVRPLTPAGAELRDYLAGLKLYITVAEADRLRYLQSPDGALRSPYRPDARSESAGTSASPDQPLQVLKLYERLLPFAALFGLEKEWSSVLGDYYVRSDTEPDWYAGSSSFNALSFGTLIGSISRASSSSWAGTASSSSGSGFSGGASVGGGGGGGGGGGV